MNELSTEIKQKARDQRKKWAKETWAIVAILYLVVTVSWLGWEIWRLAPLMRHSLHVEGKVSASYPNGHCTCKYKFSAQGREFEETGRSCCSVRVGESIDVFYLESDPRHSTNIQPDDQFWGDFVSYIFGLLLMPSIAASVVFLRTKAKAVKLVTASMDQ